MAQATPTAETAEAAVEEPAGDAKPPEAAEAVEIPKQQSADKAADSETGEGARN
ncbi:gliding motility protein [Streptomyces sp. 7N604]|uniref:gliding motility protein n=1 Tax=Streptomyces sp. 7N604 TaxID=3457415 RepID=UPI003FCEFE63